jgi:hypothetical protein
MAYSVGPASVEAAISHLFRYGVTDIFPYHAERRCCLCFGLDNDFTEKLGQIAHLDKDSANYSEDNLAWLCLPHHSTYDSKTSQHKNYTIEEAKRYEHSCIQNGNRCEDGCCPRSICRSIVRANLWASALDQRLRVNWLKPERLI